MPAKPRDRSPGIHHFWVNATSHWDYFLDDADRLTWLRLFIRVTQRAGWGIVAFCQMTTHVHGLVDVGDDSLPVGMEYLNREYSRDFNARHGRSGHLVRRRYGSRRTTDGKDLVGAYEYVVLNPVKAGICARASDWRWSSHATTAKLSNDFPFVDANKVLVEIGGSADELRAAVDARAAEIVRKRHVW